MSADRLILNARAIMRMRRLSTAYALLAFVGQRQDAVCGRGPAWVPPWGITRWSTAGGGASERPHAPEPPQGGQVPP